MCKYRRIAWTFEVFITNFFRCNLTFLNPLFWIFNLRLVEYLILRNWKTLQIMTSFPTPTGFQFLNEKLYICPHIAESANIAKNAQYRWFFLPKNFRRYWAAHCTFFQLFSQQHKCSNMTSKSFSRDDKMFEYDFHLNYSHKTIIMYLSIFEWHIFYKKKFTLKNSNYFQYFTKEIFHIINCPRF